MEGYLSFSLSSVNSNSCWAQSLINSSKASSMADRSESSACSFFCWGAAPKLFRSDPLQKETNTGSAAASRGAGPARTLCLHTLLPSVWGLPFFSWDRVSLSSLGWPEIYREPPASASQSTGTKGVQHHHPALTFKNKNQLLTEKRTCLLKIIKLSLYWTIGWSS